MPDKIAYPLALALLILWPVLWRPLSIVFDWLISYWNMLV